MIKHDCFTTNIAVQNTIPGVEVGGKTVLSLAKSKWYSLFNPILMKADPFLFVNGGILYLFYEDMGFSYGGGRIMMMFTTDLKKWSKPVEITHEPDCHFSYPWVFEDGGEIYMMPETGREHQIRLYKVQNRDLTDFKLHKVILERPEAERDGIRFDFADSCIYKKDGVYYLFTSIMKDDTYSLEIYIADSLEGDYKPHPMSPIHSGNKYGRCGGSLIEANGRLYRPAQDCENEYGGQIHLLEIDELTPTSYKEHVAEENVLPEKLYPGGGHQLNFANFKGQTLVATDMKYRCSFFLERVRLKVAHLFGLE